MLISRLTFPLGVGLVTWATPLLAGSMDPAIERLIDPSARNCRTDSGEIRLPTDGDDYVPCQPDHAAFRRLSAQYGFAFAPSAMHSAATTGMAGFEFSLQGAYTNIDESADYWKRGTRGADDPSTHQASVINSTPQPVLQLYSVKLTKSVGWGLELAGETGFMPSTSLWSMGADARLSLLEGFRKGIPGSLPDVAVGAGVRTVTGVTDFQLTVASFDTQLSKRFPVGDTVVLTPWIGYQLLWIFADSNVVDLTPATDEAELCDYQGLRTPGELPADSSPDDYTGQPICGPNGTAVDYDNNRVFDRARLERHRLVFGARLRHETFFLGLGGAVDLVAPASAQTDARDEEALDGMPRQWTGIVELGLVL